MENESASASGVPNVSSSGSPSPSFGIATIANDKVFDWVLPFLESWSRTSAHIPLHVIPYDDNCDRTRRACEAYGAHVTEPDHQALDALARRLYPLYPKHRRRLRKFLSLALPFDEVIYVDVDIVLTRDLSPFFGHVSRGECDFIVACPTTDYVYNRKRANYPFLQDAMLFNDGFFVASNKILSLDLFRSVIDRDEAIFHAVRQRGMLFAQPLTNFVTHRLGLTIKTMPQLVPDASGETFYKADGVTFDAEGRPLDICGKDIYFVHWAGAVSLPKRRVFDAAWLKLASAGSARMAAFEAAPLQRLGTL